MRDLIRAFLTVFPAELPDKSMVATIVLVARYRRPLAVWLGAVSAFAIHVTVAVAAGSAIGLLPERAVGAAVAILFAIGAVVMFRAARGAATEAEAEAALEEAALAEVALVEGHLPAVVDGGAASPTTGTNGSVAVSPGSARRAAAGAFGVIVLAEWGDLTQLATAGLAAKSDVPALTGVGAWLALASVTALAATVGRQLVARVPLHRINYVSTAIFAALAVWSAVEVLA